MPSTGSCARNVGCSIGPTGGCCWSAGPMRAEYLQGQLTNDVEALEAGDGQYAALLDRKGHMQADMRVLRPAAEEIWVDTEPEALAATRRHLEMYSIGRDVKVADVSAERAILSLIGPRAVEIAGTAALPENACEATAVAGVECLAGWDARRDRPDRRRATKPSACATPCSPPARSRSPPRPPRSSASRPASPASGPRWGRRRCRPRRASSRTPSASPRAATSARRRSPASTTRARPNRHLRGLRLSAPAAPGAALRLGEKEVGQLGGSVVSPAFGPIGLAILRREAEPGTELAVGEDGVTAQVVDVPFG